MKPADADTARMAAALLDRARGIQATARLVECRCGKQRPARDELDERVAALCPCRSCEAEFNRTMDQCPEAFQGEGWFTICGLGWAHTGPCVPYDVVEASFGETKEGS